MRVIGLLATYNERRFVGGCIEHMRDQGVDTYLIDNESTDETVAIAERYLGKGLIGIESFPRGGHDVFNWHGLLHRKQKLAGELDADWFIHLDADELRLPPPGRGTLAEALEVVDREGCNAVNFLEFTFLPTREQPDHDHPNFARTLRTYYPFLPSFPHRLNAWRSQGAVDLVSEGGHQVGFPSLKMYPTSFPMKHYLFLSVPHAIEKYAKRRYDHEEVESGWHGWRASIETSDIQLPSGADLRLLVDADHSSDLDPSNPRQRHYIDEQISER